MLTSESSLSAETHCMASGLPSSFAAPSTSRVTLWVPVRCNWALWPSWVVRMDRSRGTESVNPSVVSRAFVHPWAEAPIHCEKIRQRERCKNSRAPECGGIAVVLDQPADGRRARPDAGIEGREHGSERRSPPAARHPSPRLMSTRQGTKTRLYPHLSPKLPEIGRVTRMTMASAVR